MARTKATVRRLPVKTHQLPACIVNREYDTKKRTLYPFNLKETLPVKRTVNITKNRQAIRTINVRRKSKYFTSKNRLIF